MLEFDEVCDIRTEDGAVYVRLSEPKLLAFLSSAVARVAAALPSHAIPGTGSRSAAFNTAGHAPSQAARDRAAYGNG